MSLPLIRAGAAAMLGRRRPRTWLLDQAAGGTYARAGTATRRTSTTAIASVAADTRRTETLSGLALYLYEAPHTNELWRSEALDNAKWSKTNFPVTPDTTAAPDSTTTADTCAPTGAASQAAQAVTGSGAAWADGERFAISQWAKEITAAAPIRLSALRKDGTGAVSANLTTSGTWQRFQYSEQIAAGAGNVQGRTNAGSAGGTVSTYRWGAQYERATRYARSYIPTPGDASATCAADSLTYTSGQVDARIFDEGWEISNVRPIFANTDLVSGDIRWLVTFGGSNDGIRIRHNGTDVRLEAVEAGTVRAQSPALTFARDATLGLVEIDPVSGLVAVSGSSGPAGTPWTWSSAAVRIGGIHGGSGNEADCAIGEISGPLA